MSIPPNNLEYYIHNAKSVPKGNCLPLSDFTYYVFFVDLYLNQPHRVLAGSRVSKMNQHFIFESRDNCCKNKFHPIFAQHHENMFLHDSTKNQQLPVQGP